MKLFKRIFRDKKQPLPPKEHLYAESQRLREFADRANYEAMLNAQYNNAVAQAAMNHEPFAGMGANFDNAGQKKEKVGIDEMKRAEPVTDEEPKALPNLKLRDCEA